MAPPIGNPQRPWPAPSASWLIEQKWHDLLFMHWPVPTAVLRPLIPASFEIDTHDGSAWLGVVPFRMSGIRVRLLPPIPGTSAFPELNVRTYVRAEGKPGVWFFSLDAANALAVAAARRCFHLPYFRAQMSCVDALDAPGDAVTYRSHRTNTGAPTAEFRAEYAPSSEPCEAAPGTVDYFLTGRYCLYAADGSRLFRSEIDHAPWALQRAEVKVEVNTMASAAGITLPDTKALLHFARFQHVKIWGLQKISG
jgi:uncharacterized protein